MLPPTATLIKISNILTPHIIRICEMQEYEEKLHVISKKLSMKKGILFDSDKECTVPKLGDVVIIYNKLDIKVDTWMCRGYICAIPENFKDTYNVFLPDYGTSILLQREDFRICLPDLIPEEYLSYTIGLYNVLPAAVENDPSTDVKTLTISEEWSVSAIRYTNELISVSDAVYFDHLASDQYGRRYGELYLIIGNNTLRLIDALVYNNYAVYLEDDLLKFLKNPKDYERDETVIESETVFYMNIIRECKTVNELEKEKEKFAKASSLKKKKHIPIEVERDQEKVLIYTEDKCECLNSALDAKFPLEIHKAWRSLVNTSRPRKIQSYIWPAMKKGLDVIAVGIAKCGKTFGYGFALCGLLATNSNLPQGVNPSALILCPSSSEVLEVHYLCMELLQRYKRIRSVAAIHGKPERSLVAEMFNGCQILISTPRFLARFLDRNRKLLNFQNLRHLILDGGDVIFNKYFDSISKLFKKHNVICNRDDKKNNETMLQITVTAKYWTPYLKRIAYILMNSPYICITSFIEAVIFKSICPKIYIMNSKSKDEKFLDLLGNEYSTSRTAIVCTNDVEAEKLHKFLSNYTETLLIRENTNFTYLQGIKRCWNTGVHGSYPILICTDDVLSDLNITNVTWLIHYSVNLRSRTQFNYRFSMLLDSLQMEKCNCKVTVIVDDTSDIQFLSIIKILQRMNVSIPQHILDDIEFITATLEKKKEKYPICNNVKSWGFCSKQHSCIFRHRIIPEIDAPISNIRINDKVKFRVVSIHDVTHVSARIVSYIKFDTQEEIEFSNAEHIQITMKIHEFYSSVENRKRYDTIQVGCICGLEEPIDSFKRVQVLDIEIDEETGNPKFVDVRCVDNGVILTKLNAYRLLHIPEEFVKYPVQVVEVFLVGIVPHDEEYSWNNCATDAVYQWFEENVDEKSYVIGTVNLHLGNTIWVNSLEVGTKLIGYKDVIGSSLRTKLLNQDHAVENNEHLRKMYQLCKSAGFLDINGYDLDTLINKNL